MLASFISTNSTPGKAFSIFLGGLAYPLSTDQMAGVMIGHPNLLSPVILPEWKEVDPVGDVFHDIKGLFTQHLGLSRIHSLSFEQGDIFFLEGRSACGAVHEDGSDVFPCPSNLRARPCFSP